MPVLERAPRLPTSLYLLPPARKKNGGGFYPSPMPSPRAGLEEEPQRELDDATAALREDLAEVVDRVLREGVALRRIADLCRAASAVRDASHADVAVRLQAVVDVRTRRRRRRRVSLVEQVEDARAELQALLALAEVEVLEQRQVVEALRRSAQLVRADERARLAEGRNTDAVDVEQLVTDALARAALGGVARERWRDRSDRALGEVRAVTQVIARAVPGELGLVAA